MNTRRIVFSGVLIAFGVVLPIIFHFIPGNLGQILLPIHYSAFFGGGFFGPLVGGIVGIFTPMISHQFTTMPPNPIFIYIALETCVYGLTFGYLFYKKQLNIYIALIIAMICGRITNILSNFIIGNLIFENASQSFKLLNILNNFTVGIVGAILQLIIIPIVVNRINNVFHFKKEG